VSAAPIRPTTIQAAAPVSTGVSARPISGREPPYPESMLDSGREGSVDLDCTIETDGRARDCTMVAVRGGYAFGSAAQDWIGQVRYSPATVNGKPVETPHHRIHIVFRLQ
jgi:TonB family protein